MPISNRRLRRRLVPRRVGIFTAAMLATALLGIPALAQNYAPPPPADRPPPPPPARTDNPGLVDEIQKLLKTPSSLLPSFGSDSKDAPPPPPPTPPPPPQQSPAGPPASSQTAPPPPPPPIGGRPPSPPPAPPPPPAPAASSAPIVPSMVSGRQVCPAAPGSGADCQAAADILCRSKGYGGGKSLGVDATEKCSAKVLIPGRPREPGDCRTENFVTRAWCQ
ncbi:hypothetical protein [Rhodopseudomonas palustris]|uniref:hypothetical protein n=2 Tax=Rhodopseudomonas palustris TaxID=1076 RepID=UPI000E5BCF67|nr:hypothetical protein [Rhodopseudomonas palustris]QLH73640.1 hypothetical protein HZF03_23685 [Rhodopseudomonas palustris]RHZ92627.1 hypothetical protein D1920_21690 [Rhodopseudomonas palustris]